MKNLFKKIASFFATPASWKVTKETLQNLRENIKVAAKDRVDLFMFLLAAVLSYFDLLLGFFTFYMFFCLIRIAAFKRMNEQLKKELEKQLKKQ